MSTEIARLEDRALQQDDAPAFLFARDPAEMKAAQVHLESWLAAKAKTERAELRNLSAALAQAVKNKWRTSALRSAVQRQKRRVLFYEKGAEAVRQGYSLIPDFPVDIIAVRVKRGHPAARPTGSTHYTQDVKDERATELPVGEGRYVSPVQRVVNYSTTTEKNGKQERVYHQRAVGFQDPEFPVIAASPAVMSATAEAMARRLFDEIGVAPQHRRGDPIIVGRVRFRQAHADKGLCFLIGWCVRLKDL